MTPNEIALRATINRLLWLVKCVARGEVIAPAQIINLLDCAEAVLRGEAWAVHKAVEESR